MSKNAWSYNSTPQYAFMEWCSVKKKRHSDNFTFTFYILRMTNWEERERKRPEAWFQELTKQFSAGAERSHQNTRWRQLVSLSILDARNP
jgi:hypothetical protein